MSVSGLWPSFGRPPSRNRISEPLGDWGTELSQAPTQAAYSACVLLDLQAVRAASAVFFINQRPHELKASTPAVLRWVRNAYGSRGGECRSCLVSEAQTGDLLLAAASARTGMEAEGRCEDDALPWSRRRLCDARRVSQAPQRRRPRPPSAINLRYKEPMSRARRGGGTINGIRARRRRKGGSWSCLGLWEGHRAMRWLLPSMGCAGPWWST